MGDPTLLSMGGGMLGGIKFEIDATGGRMLGVML